MNPADAREVETEPSRWPRVALAVVGGVGLIALGVAAYAFARPSTKRFNGPIVTYRDGRKCAIEKWGFTYETRVSGYPDDGIVAPLGPQPGTMSQPNVIEYPKPVVTAVPPRDLERDLHLYGVAFGMPGEGTIAGDTLREIRFFGEEKGSYFHISSIEIDFTDRPMLVVERKPDSYRLLFGGTGAFRRAGINLVAYTKSPDCGATLGIDLTSVTRMTASVPIRVELRR